MNETVDGEFQKYSVAGGAYIREHFFGPDPRLGALVEHLSDDDLTRLRRGGHDYRKLYAAYRAATEFRGAPTVILAKTIKGWTLGPGVEGRNVTHQAKKLSEAEMMVFRDRLELPIPDAKIKDAPYFHPGPDSEEVQYLLERRRALGGSLPEADRAGAAPARARARGRRRVRRRLGRRRQHDDGLRQAAPEPDAGPGLRPPGRADHPRRGPDLRHGPALPGGRDLRQPGPALRAGRLRPRPLLPGGAGRPGPRGGDQRGGLHGLVPGRRHVVRHPRRADDPLLHLLLDVRLPADGRPGLGLRRCPRPRLHDGRHRGAHDAQRRRAPARGRPQPPPGLHRAGDPGLRPGLRVRARRDRPRRDRADVRARRGSPLLRHALQREPSDAAQARRLGRGDHPGHLPVPRSAQRSRAERRRGSASWDRARSSSRRSRHGSCSPSASAWPPRCTARLRGSSSGATPSRRSAGTASTRPTSRGCPSSARCSGATADPSSSSRTGSRRFPTCSGRWLPAGYVSLGTEGFGRSDTREALRGLFEIDAPNVAVAALAALQRAGTVPASLVAEAIAGFGIDPDKLDPLDL